MLVILAIALAGCGSSSGSRAAGETAGTATSTSGSSNVGSLPTAKFVLHAGLALGAFHRYIYSPFRSGAFSGGLFKHKLALAKAALAGVFAYRELRLALADARASSLLSKLLEPVEALAGKLAALASRLKGGHVEAGALAAAAGEAQGLVSLASGSGLSIAQQIPRVSQLAGGL